MSANPNGLSTLLPGISGSASVHSADIFQADLQHIRITLTAAQIQTMFTTPVQLVPAVAGLTIVPERMMFQMTATSTAFTGGGAVNIQYGNTGSGGGTAIGNTLAAAVITTSTPGTTQTLVPMGSSNITLTSGTGLFITNATAVFAAGTGTATVDIWYSVN